MKGENMDYIDRIKEIESRMESGAIDKMNGIMSINKIVLEAVADNDIKEDMYFEVADLASTIIANHDREGDYLSYIIGDIVIFWGESLKENALKRNMKGEES